MWSVQRHAHDQRWTMYPCFPGQRTRRYRSGVACTYGGALPDRGMRVCSTHRHVILVSVALPPYEMFAVQCYAVIHPQILTYSIIFDPMKFGWSLEALPSTHQWSATAAMGKNMKKIWYTWPFCECVHAILVPKHPRRLFLETLPVTLVTFVLLPRFEYPQKEIWWICGFSNTGSYRRWTTTQLYEEHNKYDWTRIMECSTSFVTCAPVSARDSAKFNPGELKAGGFRKGFCLMFEFWSIKPTTSGNV